MVSVTRISPKTFESKGYSAEDINLVANFDIDSALLPSSYIEFFAYSPTKQLLNSNLNYLNYKVFDNKSDEITQRGSIRSSPAGGHQRTSPAQGGPPPPAG